MANDPYTKTHVAYERLLREYHQHGKLIVALDFDDTVYDFHGEGHDYEDILELVRESQHYGFYIVLFTGTHVDNWDKQKRYLLDKGISVDSVNKNPIDLPFGNHGKIYYNILLDDRAGLGQAYEVLSLLINTIRKESI